MRLVLVLSFPGFRAGSETAVSSLSLDRIDRLQRYLDSPRRFGIEPASDPDEVDRKTAGSARSTPLRIIRKTQPVNHGIQRGPKGRDAFPSF